MSIVLGPWGCLGKLDKINCHHGADIEVKLDGKIVWEAVKPVTSFEHQPGVELALVNHPGLFYGLTRDGTDTGHYR